MNKITTKVDKIDQMGGHLEAMPVCELMLMVEALEDNGTTVGDFEHVDNSTSSVI